MEEVQLRRSPRQKEEKRTSLSYQTPYFLRSGFGGDMTTDAKGNSTLIKRSTAIYYSLLFLKVGLWITWACILSYFDLGLVHLLLPLILCFRSGLMHRALEWAKRRLQGPVTETTDWVD